MNYTVVVVGGGPAGALAALKLARAGGRVLVINRDRPDRVETAEIVSPDVRTILEAEKLWSQMPLDLTWPCPSMAAAWESPEPVWTSFSGHPDGCAWHLDRVRFDAWLSTRMREAGISIESGAVEAVRRSDPGWQVDFTTAAARHVTSCDFLVLATGRASRAVRLAPRRLIDTLCLVAGVSDPDPDEPDALIVEATTDGWWYSAPLVTGRLFAGWMTDFALVPDGRYANAAAASLERATLHAVRVGTPRLSTFVGSATWQLTPAAGPGWIAVGDAALARDPISGDGLSSALRSAVNGAAVVERALGGDETAWTEAADHAEELAARYRQQRLDLYRKASRRWPDAPFWRRFAGPDG